MAKLSHVDASGQPRMVDVGAKPVTQRCAVVKGRVRASRELLDMVRANSLKKGNLLEVARLAGIQGAKRTADLIPLCHTLPLDYVDVQATVGEDAILLRAEARTTARTGVEMEAFTAVAIAAATVIDMGKSVDRTMVIEGIRLVEKSGGRSGHYIAEDGT